VLSGREASIKRVELSGGTWYRAQVGGFASSTQANEFCDNLKAAGGQCIVQRN
jgi:cell division protein FtsN